MPLKTHHKVIIGSFSFLVVIAFVVTGIAIYTVYIQQTQGLNALKDQITELQTTSQSQINTISANLLQLKTDVETSQQQTTQQISLLKASANSDFSGVINSSIPSVVTVITNSAQGTGFIINSNGYVVTNAHVLADNSGNLASGIRVITSSQKTITAQFIGYNGTLDIALLKIPGSYSALQLGNSDKIQIGDKVVAIGNPLGLQFSASEGIISAIHRTGLNGLPYYIQTDTALNPGNSGGPLINTQGNVIGINNFKISSGENLGFALESNYIKQAVNEIAQQALNETLIP